MGSERTARYRVGGIDLAIVSDGFFYQDAGALMGVVPRTVWEPVAGTPDARNLLPLALNSLLIHSAGKLILIDTGIGAKLSEKQRTQFFPGDYGYLLARLQTIGVGPEDIHAVVNTHLHFDHCGWNTADVHGVPLPTFPNATYYIQRGEYEAATHPNERTRAAYLPENFVPLADAGRVQLLDGEVAVTSEVRIVPIPGHTADHAGVAIAANGESALYIGDVIQHGSQIARLAWIAALDVLPLISLESKRRLLDRAVNEGTLLISPHAEFPGAGRIRQRDGRLSYVPEAPLEGAE